MTGSSALGRGRHGADALIIGALASGATCEDAGRQAGVSERTVRRRLHGSEFRAEVERLQAQTIQGIAAELKSAASKATATLMELLDPSVADTVRLAAARVILDATTRYHDVGEIEERVRDIEIELYDDNGPRRSA
jgi:hypothetical protein